MIAFPPEHRGAIVRPSPNFGQRRDGRRPDILLLHYTGMETGAAAEDWLADPASQVSAHYLVHEDGSVVQMVREADRAWHAGRGAWAGDTDVNSASIGIEVVNPGHFLGYREFPETQIASLIVLCRGIVERHAIRPERVLAHSDVAPGRKIDPGEKFPWAVLAAAGIGRWLPPPATASGRTLEEGDEGPAVRAYQTALADYGYDCPTTGCFDARTRIVTEAFQRHFRPARVDGRADAATRMALKQIGTPEQSS